MKKLISAAVLSLVLAGPAFAQDAKPVIPAAPAPAASAPAAATPAAPAAVAAPVAPKPAAVAVPAAPAAPAAPTAAGKAMDAVKSAVMPAAKPAAPVAAAPAAAAPAAATPAKAAAPAAKKLININTATAAELDALPQIGEARTKAIIAGRPYKSLDELASKAKLPANAVDAIKGLVTTK